MVRREGPPSLHDRGKDGRVVRVDVLEGSGALVGSMAVVEATW
jgi:hypothetical protein